MKLSTVIALAAVGTAIALLFTTKKGSEYRDIAMDGAKKWGKKLRSQTEQMGERASEMKGQIADELA